MTRFDLSRKLTALALVVFLTGAQWAVLQGVAWAGMLIAYVQQDDLVTGVQKTFDGDHPCTMCVAIEKATQADESSQSGAIECCTPARMIGVLSAMIGNVLPENRPIATLVHADQFPPALNTEPPVPPPRIPAAS